jgi:hypothetical protein
VRVIFFITHTPNCEPLWRSLESLGHDVRAVQYDDRPHDRHGEFVDVVRDFQPDFVVFLGAYEPSHGRPVLREETLLRVREISPLIFLCGDAADDPWWPVLESYRRCGCFSAMIAIDGSSVTPISGFAEGLILLTPIDPRVFHPQSWDQRAIRLGMIGGSGHRGAMIARLRERGLIDYRPGPGGRLYEDFAALMCRTRVTLNLAQTGTGRRLHVKGRAVEAGFAGSVVLETRGSPLGSWFESGVEYLEYSDAEEVANQLAVPDQELRDIADRYRTKMIADHGPDKFWAQVLAKTGIA